MKILILILFFSLPQLSQSRNDSPAYNSDSMNYVMGKKSYKDGYYGQSENYFRRIFSTHFNKWCDSAKTFLKMKKKMKWLNGINEVSLNGYTYADSIYFELGRQLFLKEDWEETHEYFKRFPRYFELSVYYDSAQYIVNFLKPIMDSTRISEQRSLQLSERNWVFIGDFYDEDKFGVKSYFAYPTFYDVNHLLYEGDTVCVLLKVGKYSSAYRYVSVNLVTKVIHGIDASFSGFSYNYIWDGDWWRDPVSDFASALYEIVINKPTPEQIQQFREEGINQDRKANPTK